MDHGLLELQASSDSIYATHSCGVAMALLSPDKVGEIGATPIVYVKPQVGRILTLNKAGATIFFLAIN
jgi:hypothetical protein